MIRVLLLSTVIVLLACSRNKQIAQPYRYQYSGQDETNIPAPTIIRSNYYRNLAPPLQVFNFQNDTVIIGQQGTTLELHRSCFTQDSSAKLRLELLEVYSKKDMILSNRATNCGKKILESNGELFVRVLLDDKEISPLCEEGLIITMANPKKPGFTLFSGFENPQTSAFTWVLDTTNLKDIGLVSDVNENNFMEGDFIYNADSGSVQAIYSTSNTVEQYMFSARKLGWINCDRFYEDSAQKTDLIVQLNNDLPLEYPHRVYAVFDSINSVMPLYSPDNKTFRASGIPVGQKITVIALGATDLKTFFGKQNITIHADTRTQVELKPMAKEDITKELNLF